VNDLGLFITFPHRLHFHAILPLDLSSWCQFSRLTQSWLQNSLPKRPPLPVLEDLLLATFNFLQSFTLVNIEIKKSSHH